MYKEEILQEKHFRQWCFAIHSTELSKICFVSDSWYNFSIMIQNNVKINNKAFLVIYKK